MGMDRRGALLAALAMSLVGSSVAAASIIGDYPILTGQAIRYAAASVLLFLWALLTRRKIERPSGRDFLWLGAVALIGMVLFNVLLILATDRVDPSLVGAIAGSAPIVLAVVGALQMGRSPKRSLVLGAVLVTIGTALVVQARVDGDFVGIVLAVGVMIAEVGFSLLAVPVLPRVGPIGVAAHGTWLAAVMLVLGAVFLEGADAFRMPTAVEAAAFAHLTILVTAVAFVAWYTAVDRLGADTAGLFAGLIPVSALLVSALIGTDTITTTKLVGVFVVGAGVAYGLNQARESKGH